MKVDEVIVAVKRFISDHWEEVVYGGGSSITWSVIIPEALHMMAVLITTALSIIVAHYVKKWLKEKEDGNNS